MNKNARIKLGLLTEGLSVDSSFSLGANDARATYIYNSSNDVSFELPSEIVLPDNITSNIFLAENSRWRIEDKKLFYENRFMTTVEYTPMPNFSGEILSDGTLASKVAAMFGKDVFSIYVNRNCFLFKNSLGCHFCSTNIAKNGNGKENLKNITREQVQETFQIGLKKDGFNNAMITSGTYENFDQGILDQLGYLKAMREVDVKGVHYHMVTMPPKSNELIHAMRSSGLDTFAFDIEVFDKELFERYCPGKSKYFGYNQMLEKFEYAAKIFPKNSVKAGFVCGLESLESLTQGMEYFGKLGISSSLNIFHPDPKTPLENFSRPTREYLLAASQEQDKVNQKYGLIPIFEKFGRRSSLDTEVYRGFLKNE